MAAEHEHEAGTGHPFLRCKGELGFDEPPAVGQMCHLDAGESGRRYTLAGFVTNVRSKTDVDVVVFTCGCAPPDEQGAWQVGLRLVDEEADATWLEIKDSAIELSVGARRPVKITSTKA